VKRQQKTTTNNSENIIEMRKKRDLKNAQGVKKKKVKKTELKLK
jgi:hypothetical protein